jgi:hypothetical protein
MLKQQPRKPQLSVLITIAAFGVTCVSRAPPGVGPDRAGGATSGGTRLARCDRRTGIALSVGHHLLRDGRPISTSKKRTRH